MTFYVTTPIYYVNAQPHLGHAYTTIAADVIARHMRQRGEDVFFLTGTDEHGEPVADAARAQGLEPKELADRNAERFRALMPQLEISNDFFIRTSDPQHMAEVQEVLQRVHDNGHTYKGIYEGWYCPRCADFKVENEILEGNRCPIHFIELTREQEENWFFRLSTFQEPVERLYAERPDFVMPPHHYNEARSFILSGLQDVSLSRARLTWGMPVPWDLGPRVLRLVRRASELLHRALVCARRRRLDCSVLACEVPHHRQGHPQVPHRVLARDADGRRPDGARARVRARLSARRRWPQDEQVAGQRARPVRGDRPVRDRRAALLPDARRSVRLDGAVGMEGVRTRYETELANEYGNLASRTIAMVQRYRDGVVPAVPTDPSLDDELEGLPQEVAALMDRAEPTVALDRIWQRVRRLNRYVQEQAPWQLAKDPAAADELDRTLASLVEGLRTVNVMLEPYMPATTEKLRAALGSPGGSISSLEPLFPKR